MVSESGQRGMALMTESTRAFIADDPVAIALTPGRGTAVETSSGGIDYTDASPRDEQNFKVINTSGDSTIPAGSDGAEVRKFSYVIVGMPDAVVEVGDWWVDGPNRYTVTAILHRNGYEVKASVEAFGPEPNYG